MKVAIVGSRGYGQLGKVAEYVESLPLDTTIISGGASGVDHTAEIVAKQRGMKTLIFIPDWEAHGKAAGMIRNSEIVNTADRLVAFWDGVSRGTMDSIHKAMERGIEVEVING